MNTKLAIAFIILIVIVLIVVTVVMKTQDNKVVVADKQVVDEQVVDEQVVDEQTTEVVVPLTDTLFAVKSCSVYEPTDKNISPECLLEMWNDAGCTTNKTTWGASDNWRSLASFKNDAAAWARKTNDPRCYGPTEQPVIPVHACSKYSDTDTGISQACLNTIWKEGGCTRADHWVAVEGTWAHSKTIPQLKADAAKWSLTDGKIYSDEDKKRFKAGCNP
jgi:hypothetical protein